MPLFANKFSPKKIPLRRHEASVLSRELGSEFASRELGLEIGPIDLKLNDFEVKFVDGQWIPVTENSGAFHKENVKLKKALKHLEEENNMLKLKFEILLDLLTQTTVESQIQSHEIEELKSNGVSAYSGKHRKGESLRK